MEFLPGIFLFGIVLLLILRLLKGRDLGTSGMEPDRKRMGNVDDTLVAELRQRAESRRLRLKREGITVESSKDINLEFSGICPSCLKQNEQDTHYCVFCGMKLNLTRSELTSQDYELGTGLALETGQDREAEWIQDGLGKTSWDIEQGLEEEDLHEITSLPLASPQNLQKNSNLRSSTQNLFSSDPGPLSRLDSKIGLKHAILLSEILGPPISISRQKFWEISN